MSDQSNQAVDIQSKLWSPATVEHEFVTLRGISDMEMPLNERIKHAESRLGNALKSSRVIGQRLTRLWPGETSDEGDSARQMLEVMYGLADTYRELGNYVIDKAGRTDRKVDRTLAWCLYREMGCMYELAMLGHTAFMSPRKGFWSQVHRIYETAAKHDVLTVPTDGSVAKRLNANTISQLYIVLVLTGLADVYQLPFRGAYHVERIARKLRDRVTVLDSCPDDFDLLKLFVLTPDSDAPAISFDSDTIKPKQMVTLLNTTDVVNLVAQRRRTLTQHPRKSDPDFPGESKSDLRLLYRHIGKHWTYRPEREDTRASASGGITLLVSFDILLEGLRQVTEDAVVPMLPKEPVSLSASEVSEVSESLPTEAIAGELIDTSAGGQRLRIPHSSSVLARVGELIGWRDTYADGRWRIGIVRWIREEVPGHIDLGIQKIRGRPTVAEISSGKSADDPNAKSIPVIAISHKTNEGPRTTVIMSNIGDENLKPLCITQGSEVTLISSAVKVLNTPVLRGFRCELK